LVFETGGRTGEQFTLVTKRKGRATFRITVEGQGAHAGSQHQRGANAILELARLIQQIEGFTDYSRHLTFNVGTVTGGTVVNRVPHRAQAEVEMRAFSREVYQAGLNSILNLNHDSTAPEPNQTSACRVRVELTREAPPWPSNESTDRLFALWQETARQIGVNLEPEERGGLSDGNFLCLAIPTLDGLGPCGGNVHCSECSPDGAKLPEYLDVNSLIPKATLNTLALDRLIQSIH
jgi:glutamate carboxypeptidase